jgi:hypothetical protein
LALFTELYKDAGQQNIKKKIKESVTLMMTLGGSKRVFNVNVNKCKKISFVCDLL